LELDGRPLSAWAKKQRGIAHVSEMARCAGTMTAPKQDRRRLSRETEPRASHPRHLPAIRWCATYTNRHGLRRAHLRLVYPLISAAAQQYIEAKFAGSYGHSPKQVRRFLARLAAKRGHRVHELASADNARPVHASVVKLSRQKHRS